MSTWTQRDETLGLVAGLRDALRALMIGDVCEGDLWRLGEDEIGQGLALVGQVRQLAQVAEVALAREGIERGLPTQSSWSAHDWLTTAESEAAAVPSAGHVSSVVRVAQASTIRTPRRA